MINCLGSEGLEPCYDARAKQWDACRLSEIHNVVKMTKSSYLSNITSVPLLDSLQFVPNRSEFQTLKNLIHSVIEMDSDLTFGAAINFVTKCKNELKWEDLSKDTVMDVGCGYNFYCSRAILHQFPNVGRLIALDMHPSIIMKTRLVRDEMFKNKIMSNIVQYCAADIEIRDSLQTYKGSIDKVVSRNVFHQIENKELAIENIYHLLKPGGDAALLFFFDNPIFTWYCKIMSMEKWSKYIDTTKLISPYFPGKLEKDYYKNVMQSVGFQEVRSEIINIPLVYRNDEICLNELLQIIEGIFNIPPERNDEFKCDLLECFKNIIGSKSEPICYTIVGLFLFAVKPSISLASEN
ncbi:uncharacterized protein NPIL_413521 [Nephila pilipes]|uniref:Methyltransferase domain-containing protein n=1 Tax=Nephila pilipes TaxID=299642 RepID=A0A8X6Q9M5_NEPPI|nr:uncharacterized protein NPIL_413521 [Nephila pilipes]